MVKIEAFRPPSFAQTTRPYNMITYEFVTLTEAKFCCEVLTTVFLDSLFLTDFYFLCFAVYESD